MIAKKKSTAKKSKRLGATANTTCVLVGNGLPLSSRSNGARKQPYRINPETNEEREKRLAARKALTLKAARIAYENHHRRKAS
ncbi:MAG TPA: hypothetical protein VGN95_18405 [Pyrinomonadaceae bacterium]|jgi:hypothetical protein|nr:hypothetical protein [Pyrinomonadaceae bacterium]